MRKSICVIILLVVSLSLLTTSSGWSWWGKRDCSNPQWSPDSKKIAFITSGLRLKHIIGFPIYLFMAIRSPEGVDEFGEDDLYVMNIDGSHKKKVAKNVNNYAWSPDGKRIVYDSFVDKNYGQRDIYVVDINGRHRKRLTKNTWDDEVHAWSPDGKKITFSSQEKKYGRSGIFTMNPDGSDKRFLTKGGRSYVWSPDGEKIAFTGSHTIVIKNPDGTDIKKVDVKSLNENYRISTPKWSPDGKWIAVKASYWRKPSPRIYTCDLLLVDRNGNNLKRLITGFEGSFDWLDNNHILYNYEGNGYRTKELWVKHTGLFAINIDGTGKKKIARSISGFRLSPDKKKMLSGDRDIIIQNIDGSGGKVLTLGR